MIRLIIARIFWTVIVIGVLARVRYSEEMVDNSLEEFEFRVYEWCLLVSAILAIVWVWG